MHFVMQIFMYCMPTCLSLAVLRVEPLLCHMVTSCRQNALRQFACVIKAVAKTVNATLPHERLSRCGEKEVLEAYKALLKKAHPDKGGTAEAFRTLFEAKAAWDVAATRDGGRPGRNAGSADSEPPATSPPPARPRDSRKRPAPPPVQPTFKRPAAARSDPTRALMTLESTTPAGMCVFCHDGETSPPEGFMIQSKGVMLTYNGTALQSSNTWADFQAWVLAHKKEWHVLYHSATKEKCRNGRDHLHLMLQFHREVKMPSKAFMFNGVKPNATPSWKDYCGNGRQKKNPQQGLDRAFFYVWAFKIGTCLNEDGLPCVAGNYAPVWTEERFRYEVQGVWPETLWRKRYLTHDKWKEYIVLCRDRVPARQCNLQRVVQGEEDLDNAAEIAENLFRIRNNPDIYKRFKVFVEVEKWKRAFDKDRLRYPSLLIHGESFTGKTEFAKSLFPNPLCLKVGKLIDMFPEKMRQYNRKFHTHIVLDDLRDVMFLSNFQHVLQGKPDEMVAFAETAGGTCAYEKLLFRTPFVATINNATANLHLLDTNDFLSKPQNIVVLWLKEPPVEKSDDDNDGGTASEPEVPVLGPGHASSAPTPSWHMWSVAELSTYLKGKDMHAAARCLQANDVNGKDFAALTEQELVGELGMPSFSAKKVIRIRAEMQN
jgi:hypothetical protein